MTVPKKQQSPPFTQTPGQAPSWEIFGSDATNSGVCDIKPPSTKLPLKVGDIQDPQQTRRDFRTDKQQRHWNTASSSEDGAGSTPGRRLSLGLSGTDSLCLGLHRGWPAPSGWPGKQHPSPQQEFVPGALAPLLQNS